jgi:uncharacterized protein YqcC (DUF446 family)
MTSIDNMKKEMKVNDQLLHDQIEQIKEAMKKAGVWSKEEPDWIRYYQEGPIDNIWHWLQFIHLPSRSAGTIRKPYYLAPQLRSHINSDPKHHDILQLVIELDSISSTLHKQ